MRAVVQRVLSASVSVEGETVGAIERGLCVLVGVHRDDAERDAEQLAEKVVGLRIFSDLDDKMNLSVAEAGGAVLAVSQFTLLGDTRKGKRPGFSEAMNPERANELFEPFCRCLATLGIVVQKGKFRAHMLVRIENDGPVTLLIDTQKVF